MLNELKVRHINRLLKQVHDVLGGDPSTHFLETLDETTLPQNGDAVLILGQWIAAIQHFRRRYNRYDGMESHRWDTQENPITDATACWNGT